MQAQFYAPRTKRGKIVAFADVELGEGVFVRGFRIVDGDNGRFAAVPSRPVTVNGATRYWNQIAFATKTRKESFLAALLEAYDRWVDAGAPEPASASLGIRREPEAETGTEPTGQTG